MCQNKEPFVAFMHSDVWDIPVLLKEKRRILF